MRSQLEGDWGRGHSEGFFLHVSGSDAGRTHTDGDSHNGSPLVISLAALEYRCSLYICNK